MGLKGHHYFLERRGGSYRMGIWLDPLLMEWIPEKFSTSFIG